jgi:hypothetical protein
MLREEIVEPSHSALVVLDVQNIAVDLIFNKDEFITNLNSRELYLHKGTLTCCIFKWSILNKC